MKAESKRPPQYLIGHPLYLWPSKHLVKRMRQEKLDTGKTLTRIFEESICARYKLPIPGASKYPDHNAQSQVLNEG